MDKAISAQKILFYVLQFGTGWSVAGSAQNTSMTGFRVEWDVPGEEQDLAQPGDLVMLTAIRHESWLLAWLHETRMTDFGREYLCENIQTGEMCWWSNVGIKYFSRKDVQPEWRWTDRQWAFNSRWVRTCRKKHRAHMLSPLYVDFDEDDSVTLKLRERYSRDGKGIHSKKFEDWRKVRIADMSEFYLATEKAMQ